MQTRRPLFNEVVVTVVAYEWAISSSTWHYSNFTKEAKHERQVTKIKSSELENTEVITPLTFDLTLFRRWEKLQS